MLDNIDCRNVISPRADFQNWNCVAPPSSLGLKILLSCMIHKLIKSKHYPSEKVSEQSLFLQFDIAGMLKLGVNPLFSQNVVCGLHLSVWKTVKGAKVFLDISYTNPQQ